MSGSIAKVTIDSLYKKLYVRNWLIPNWMTFTCV